MIRFWLGALALCSANAISADSTQVYGHLRERLTYLSAVEFDEASPEAGTFWTQRLTLGVNHSFSDNWSFHGSLLSALQEGVDASPIERNNLDIFEAYGQYKGQNFTALVGRQTLKLGSQRLIGWRDGTNVKRSWQGLRVTLHGQDKWQSEWLAMELIDVEPNGVFNDNPTSDHQLAGTYHTLDLTQFEGMQVPDAQLELYYFYTNRNQRSTIEGQANQIRHTLGTRFSGEGESWYWDWEAAYQFGDHGDSEIQAWTVATNTGFRFEGILKPEIMLSVNVASGDRQQGDNKLGTFDALYPRGSYFSEAAILGPANFYNFHPYFIVYPSEGVRAFIDMNMYWRLEKTDGIYGPPGNIIAAPGQSDSDNVNLAYSTGVEWEMNDTVNLSLLATYSRPRSFLRESGVTDNTRFVEFTVNWTLFD